jgi:hypothetical protein
LALFTSRSVIDAAFTTAWRPAVKVGDVSVGHDEESPMRTRKRWWSAVLLAVVLGLPFAGAPQAQTTTVDVREFEVISVDGNNLVVRDQKGTQEYSVPDDFRFTIDGRKMSVKELKPGMKGTATVTTKTTITPVTLTEIKQGTVVSATEFSVTVRGSEGLRRFTQSQLDERGVQILKDGRIIRIRDLRQGDQITATFISKAPPVVVTEKEVQATLAQTAPATPAAAAPTQAEAPAPTQAEAPAPTQAAAPEPKQAEAATQSATAPPASPAPAAVPPPQATAGTPWVWFILVAVVLALLWFFLVRKKGTS